MCQSVGSGNGWALEGLWLGELAVNMFGHDRLDRIGSLCQREGVIDNSVRPEVTMLESRFLVFGRRDTGVVWPGCLAFITVTGTPWRGAPSERTHRVCLHTPFPSTAPVLNLLTVRASFCDGTRLLFAFL